MTINHHCDMLKLIRVQSPAAHITRSLTFKNIVARHSSSLSLRPLQLFPIKRAVNGIEAGLWNELPHLSHRCSSQQVVQDQKTLFHTAIWPRMVLVVEQHHQEKIHRDISQMFKHTVSDNFDTYYVLDFRSVVLLLLNNRPIAAKK